MITTLVLYLTQQFTLIISLLIVSMLLRNYLFIVFHMVLEELQRIGDYFLHELLRVVVVVRLLFPISSPMLPMLTH